MPRDRGLAATRSAFVFWWQQALTPAVQVVRWLEALRQPWLCVDGPIASSTPLQTLRDGGQMLALRDAARILFSPLNCRS